MLSSYDLSCNEVFATTTTANDPMLVSSTTRRSLLL
jgi:hypothetical protein